MYTGAISSSDISCDHEHTPSIRPECGLCRNARYKVDRLPHAVYWCINFNAVEKATLDISFHYLTYVNNLKIEAFATNRLCEFMEIHIATTPGEYSAILHQDLPKQVFIYYILIPVLCTYILLYNSRVSEAIFCVFP